MKYILFFLISFSSLAQPYYLKVSDFEACKNGEAVSLWSPKHLCEGECMEWPSGASCDTVNLQDVFVNDISRPIRNKTDSVSCEGEQACQLALESLECEDKFINESYSEAYCSKVIGYEQKFSHKVAVVDQDKLDHKQAKENAIMQIEEAKKYLAETDYMVIRDMEGGEPMPLEVKNQRAAKRVLINSLETEFNL